ncbi:hypothetical protein HII17_04745 [Thalassotalea sp. M1531]|uniref:DUF7793 domain-containing protein n=1 Tax=Thalassotalea algicola TaxID=2716224 RepID=A0A7Y0LAA4_9GAMM|nr:hypothetical protein [Thalassotalea algicola]NMP30864.1 hypothetical protein [Thalassotalea algicola]
MSLVHGDFEITFDNNTLMVKLSGSFNELGTLKLTDLIKNNIENLNGQKFYMLVDDRELDGFTPEAYQVIEENNHWLGQQNLLAKAFIMRNLVQESLDNYFIPSKKGQNTKAFTDMASAIAWLNTQQ